MFDPGPKGKCRKFKDNGSSTSIAKSQKNNKDKIHMEIKYHKFRSHIDKRISYILSIGTRKNRHLIFLTSCSTKNYCMFKDEIMWIVTFPRQSC